MRCDSIIAWPSRSWASRRARCGTPSPTRSPGSSARACCRSVSPFPRRPAQASRRAADLARQRLVLDAVRLVGGRAEAAVAVFLVGLVVALEPHHLAVALEGEDVRGDAIEEPAVVRGDQHAAGELGDRLFQRT